MKIFQIMYTDPEQQHGIVHWECNTCSTIEETAQKYAQNIIFFEAPDYVREGWGFDATKEGDARFVEPVSTDPPVQGDDGIMYYWVYDKETGTFCLKDENGNLMPSRTELLEGYYAGMKEEVEG